MRQLLLWSLFMVWTVVFTSCQQKLDLAQEIIFIDNQSKEQENVTIDLEDVFYAKANWESNTYSQLEQNHISPSSSSVNRAVKTSSSLKTSTKKPQIRVANDVYDFGFVDEGELVAHSFRMHNDGPGTWEIEEILPSCGCTNVKVTSKEVVSGAYVDVSFNLETAGRPGAQQKLIEIFSYSFYHRHIIKGVVCPPKFSQEETATDATKDSI
ncbi:MAG: DUF1573 domain-containing protein [Bacteroidia bacterium]